MKKQLMILAVVAAAAIALPGTPVRACDGCGAGGGWWGYGYLYNSLEYNVPYFAAHPPVYYSYPVPRTYGYSPFAYPPNVMTPEVTLGPEQPLEIVNPYVPSSKASTTPREDQSAAASRDQREPQPLVIINPYVSGANAIAQAEK